MNSNFERKDFVLACVQMDERHTGENIALKIEEILTENGFLLEKMAGFVRDDAANMQKSAKLLDKPRLILNL